jgi:DNA-binding NtrC family response regulator
MTTAIAPSTFAVTGPSLAEVRCPLNILIVDHERSVRDACREVAASLGYHASAIESAEQALRLAESQTVDLVFVDLMLHGTSGLELLRKLKARRPETEVVMMTGHETIESAVEAMKSGAYDYLIKAFTLGQLKLLLDRISVHMRLKTENRILGEKIKSKQGFGQIIERAPEMDKLYRIVAKAAHSAHPVLILGESGTGKEMVARAIHHSGPFRD